MLPFYGRTAKILKHRVAKHDYEAAGRRNFPDETEPGTQTTCEVISTKAQESGLWSNEQGRAN